MLTSVAFRVYPYLLSASTDSQFGLIVHNAGADEYGLGIGLAWWIPGMILAIGYPVYTYRRFAGKVRSQVQGY